MTAVIEKVISSFKSMLSDLEKQGREVISQISAISEKVASEIELIFTDIFRDVKTRVSRLLQAFEMKLKALTRKRQDTELGPNASGFASKIQVYVKEGERLVERMSKDFSETMKSIIKELKEVSSKIEAFFKTSAEDTSIFVRKAVEDFHGVLVTIGKDTIREFEKFSDDVVKEIEIDASFVYKHGLVIAEAATLSVLNIPLVLGMGASVAIVVAATKYEPS